MISTKWMKAGKQARIASKLAKLYAQRTFGSYAKGFNAFWLDKDDPQYLSPEELKVKRKEYDEQGFTVLKNYFDHETIDSLRDEMENIISDAERSNSLNNSAVFTTSKQIETLSKSVDYFLDSASKISFFYEKDAFDENGNLKGPLNLSLNKVGHAMHDLNPVFNKFCYSNAMKMLANNILGFVDPILAQTMYIFKSPKVGGEVNPHQDSTYLITNPLSCRAIWIALDDATKENGWMWGIPASHKTTPIDYYMRAERKDILDENGKFLRKESKITYDPEEPPKYKISNEVPLEMPKGSIVLFDGAFVHYSDHNYSNKRRHAFTMHMFEGKNTVWDKTNWLQRTPELPFRKMLKENL